MLLPSALSCDGGRAIPSSASMLLSPAPRHATRIPQVALFASSPAIGREETSSLRSSAVEGIFMTCKRLHQILSLEPPRSASTAPHQVSATTQTHNAFNSAIASPLPSTDAPSIPRARASQPAQSSTDQLNRLAVPSLIPRTPTPKNSDIVRIPKTPMRRNKRRRSDDSDDDGFYHVRVQSPKRPRLSTLPASALESRTAQSSRFNRRSRQMRIEASKKAVTPEPTSPSTSLTPNALQLVLNASSPVEEVPQTDLMSTKHFDNGRDWSNAEDRLLVEMVLQKMRLSPRDWADCARSLGRDPMTVGNRWEEIVGNLMGGVREGRIGSATQKRRRLEDSERR